MPAEYRSHCDSSESICPYCGESFQPEASEYSEVSKEIECFSCGKKYHLVQIFTVDHHSLPNCELNGEEHKWVPRDVGHGKTHPFCSVCDRPKSEFDDYFGDKE